MYFWPLYSVALIHGSFINTTLPWLALYNSWSQAGVFQLCSFIKKCLAILLVPFHVNFIISLFLQKFLTGFWLELCWICRLRRNDIVILTSKPWKLYIYIEDHFFKSMFLFHIQILYMFCVMFHVLSCCYKW